MPESISETKVALITGAAQRIGAHLARALHAAGYNILIHYRQSEGPAQTLATALNAQRADSAACVQADLQQLKEVQRLADEARSKWQRVDVLINNAARFNPNKLGTISSDDWDALINSNLRAPLFLCQALAEELTRRQGCIVNMVDIYAERPLKDYSLYCIAKAGMAMLTKSMAQEMGAEVRVNGIAPGAILWPENAAELSASSKQNILDLTTLKRAGSPEDICETALFLIQHAPYITGQIINVDGGRSLNQ